MPDIAMKFESSSIKMKDCEYVANPFSKFDDDDDDDFDEDDDDEPEGKKTSTKKKLKIMPISQVLCSFKDQANDKLEELWAPWFTQHIQDYPNPSIKNSWYVIQTTEIPNTLLCQGIQLKDWWPTFLQDGRFVLRANI